jgi:hypothetical protein
MTFSGTLLTLESLAGARRYRPTNPPPTIGISPGDDSTFTQTIQRIEVTKGMRTLGIVLRLAPDGNDNNDEFK